MKKRLEADLISIAHRVLQLKNKSDINQLYLETQKLYEKLSVLKYIDEQYGDVKPTIGRNEVEKEMESFYNKQESLPVETIVEMTEEPIATFKPTQDEIEETVEENEEIIVDESTPDEDPVVDTAAPEMDIIPETAAINTDFEADIKEEIISESDENTEDLEDTTDAILGVATPEESFMTDTVESESIPEFDKTETVAEDAKIEAVQISFEDLLGINYSDTQFIKVEDMAPLAPEPIFDAVKEKVETEEVVHQVPEKTTEEEIVPEITNIPPPVFEKPVEVAPQKNLSLNDKFSKGIDIDLNDRIAFVKHLFGNSEEDYNRVLSQLITFDNFYETRNFIEEMVKPDYNNWKGKDDYAERFIDIIEKKFL